MNRHVAKSIRTFHRYFDRYFENDSARTLKRAWNQLDAKTRAVVRVKLDEVLDAVPNPKAIGAEAIALARALRAMFMPSSELPSVARVRLGAYDRRMAKVAARARRKAADAAA
jgi:hypothetical protein